MVKRVLLLLVLLIVVVFIAVFTHANTSQIEVDLLIAKVTTTMPLAFIVAFAAGWLFGLLSLSLWGFRLVRERRMLKRALSASETEVSSLRSLPLSDAD